MRNSLVISISNPIKDDEKVIEISEENLHSFNFTKIEIESSVKQDTSSKMESITITRKPQGHLIIAHEHFEKVLLAGFKHESFDLGTFSENWKGCSITLHYTEA
jgi:hypothetical protein